MTAVALTVASATFAYLLDAVFVGASLGVLRFDSATPIGRGRLFGGLVAVFAVLDLYWIPAFLALDLTMKIGDPGAASVFGGEFPATKFLSLGWFDFLVWATQGLVAVWVADRVSRRTHHAI